jgi:hypothetical protein
MTAPTKGQATIGDALIFVAKCLFATLALVAALIVAVIWWFNKVGDLQSRVHLLGVQKEAFQRKVNEQDITIADLGSRLNQCLVNASAGTLPMPPEGFVIDHEVVSCERLERAIRGATAAGDDEAVQRLSHVLCSFGDKPLPPRIRIDAQGNVVEPAE